ncbi:MAG: peptidoglycan-associated lipoprotein Pal [Parvularculaceae bacterium]
MGCKSFLTTLAGAGALALIAGCATTPSEPDSTVADQAQTTVADSAQRAEPAGPPAGSLEDLIASAGGNQVFFDFDRFDLRPDAQASLRRQAAWLRANPDVVIQLQGNCDERGTREYNLALGNSRAEAAKAFLVSQGIDGSRIRTISFGKERPVCTASNESCWQRNRNATTVVQRSGM